MVIDFSSYLNNNKKNEGKPANKLNKDSKVKELISMYSYELENYKFIIKNSDLVSKRIQEDIANVILGYLEQYYEPIVIGNKIKEWYGSKYNFRVKLEKKNNKYRGIITVTIEKAS